MSLLTRATIICINPEQLDRLAREEHLAARDICLALMPPSQPSRKHTLAPTVSPDYMVRSILQMEQQATAAKDGIRTVLNKIVAACRANNVNDVVFPHCATRLTPP